MRVAGKKINKDYFASTWFISLLIIIGYVAGVFFARCVLELDVNQTVVVGFFGAMLFSVGFMPYFFDVTYLLFNKYRLEYSATFTRLSFETINQMKKQKDITPEKEKEILRFFNSSVVITLRGS